MANTKSHTTRRRHEWIYPDAPSPRQCRYCLRGEYEINTGSQVIGFCEGVMAESQTTIGGHPAVRQKEVHRFVAHCPICDFGHVSTINMDGCVIRCECGSPFRVAGKDETPYD